MPRRKCIERDADAETIAGTVPVRARQLEAAAEGAVDLGEGERFGAAVVPAGAQEQAGVAVVGQRQLAVEAEAIPAPAGALVGGDVGHAAAGLRGGDGLPVHAHRGDVAEGQQAQRPAIRLGLHGQLDLLAAGLAQRRHQALAVGVHGHPVDAVAQAPARIHPGQHHAVGVAAGIGGEIPGGVVEQRPVHELGARAAGVAVLVEVVAGGHLADLDLDPPHGFRARQLILGTLPCRGGVAEGQRPAQEAAGHVGALAEPGGAGADHVAVGQAAQPGGVADAAALEHFHVEVELQACRQGHAEVGAESVRAPGVAAGVQAQRAGVGRVQRGLVLVDEGVLRAQPLGHEQGRVAGVGERGDQRQRRGEEETGEAHVLVPCRGTERAGQTGTVPLTAVP